MLWAENFRKLQLLEQKIAFSKRKYLSIYKPPQENFFEKALWPKISPGAYYWNFTVYLLTGDIFDKLQHSTYALGIVTLELLCQRQKAKELYATYRLKTNYLDISITVLKFLK